MARRLPNVVVLVALVLAPWSASEAFAQVRSELPLVDFGAAVGQAFGQPVRLSDFEQRPVQLPRPAPGTQSSTALKSLYATTIVMRAEMPTWLRKLSITTKYPLWMTESMKITMKRTAT